MSEALLGLQRIEYDRKDYGRCIEFHKAIKTRRSRSKPKKGSQLLRKTDFTAKSQRTQRDSSIMMEKLIVMWKGMPGGIQTLGQLMQEVDLPQLPRHQVGWAQEQTGKVYYATQSVELEASTERSAHTQQT